jgi:hypothetical protein
MDNDQLILEDGPAPCRIVDFASYRVARAARSVAQSEAGARPASETDPRLATIAPRRPMKARHLSPREISHRARMLAFLDSARP